MSTPNAPTDQEPSFTTSYTALEEILGRFKQGSTTLEESLALFEEGFQHLKNCQAKLSKARGSVEELVSTLQADGEIVTRPFNDSP